MANIRKVNIGEGVINTTIITDAAELDESLRHLLSVAQLGPLMQVVGLDIEKQFAPSGNSSDPQVTEKVATLMLCCGTSCLIIKLSSIKDPSAFCSVSRFLQLEELKFVGIRMRYCLEALEKCYGIKCRNAFELNSRGDRGNSEFLREYRLIDLAYSAGGITLQYFLQITEAERIYKAAALSDWGAATLSHHQITAATLRAFLCFFMGNHSCEGYVTRNDFWKHPYDYDPIRELYESMRPGRNKVVLTRDQNE